MDLSSPLLVTSLKASVTDLAMVPRLFTSWFFIKPSLGSSTLNGSTMELSPSALMASNKVAAPDQPTAQRLRTSPFVNSELLDHRPAVVPKLTTKPILESSTDIRLGESRSAIQSDSSERGHEHTFRHINARILDVLILGLWTRDWQADASKSIWSIASRAFTFFKMNKCGGKTEVHIH